MAKKNHIEECIFCGCAPCECGGTKSKKAAPKATKPKAPIVAFEREDEKSGDIFGDVPEAATRFKAPEKHERDLSVENALRTLRPIVSDQSKTRIDKMLKRNYPQDVDRRVAEWRKAHGILG